MADIADVTAALDDRRAFLPGKRVKLDFGEAGIILLDGITEQVSNVDGPADATIRISIDNFVAMAQGRLSGAVAFMQGKLKVSGDMTTAMQFQSVTAKLRCPPCDRTSRDEARRDGRQLDRLDRRRSCSGSASRQDQRLCRRLAPARWPLDRGLFAAYRDPCRDRCLISVGCPRQRRLSTASARRRPTKRMTWVLASVGRDRCD